VADQISAIEWGVILPAVGGALVLAVKAIWNAIGVTRKEEIATLKAELKHEREERERERADAKETLKRLGEKHDALVKAREEDFHKMASYVLSIGAAQETGELLPTGVHRLVDIVPAGMRSSDSTDKMQRVRPPEDTRYSHSSDDSTPPEERPLPRPKLPSRPR
jgi:hypothetical protein